MIKEGKFGTFEAVCLSSLFILSKLFYTNMGFLVKTTGTAAWLSSLTSFLTSLFFFFIIYTLMKRFPGKNLFEIMNDVLGKFLSGLIGIGLSAYFLYYSASTTREFVEMLKTFNLPFTPISYLIASVLIVAIILSNYGLETIVRVSTIWFLPFLAGVILVLILAIPEYNPNLLKPYFGYGFFYTIQQGLLRSSGYTEIIFLTIIVTSLQTLKTVKRTGFITISICGIIFVIAHICYVMFFSYVVAREHVAGFFEITRSIYANRFFQRIESIFIFLWVSASVITVSISFYLGVTSYCKVFKLNNYKALLLPASFLVFMVAMLNNNLSEVILINMIVLRNYSMLFLFMLPTLLLILALLFRKGGNTN